MNRLTASEDAQVSQQLAVLADVERAWPYNGHLYNDTELNTVIRERIEQPWQTVRPDRADILWPDGRRTELEPHQDVIRAVASSTPPHRNNDCDRCYSRPNMAIALVAAPPHIVALALCGPCVMKTNAEELTWIRKEQA